MGHAFILLHFEPQMNGPFLPVALGLPLNQTLAVTPGQVSQLSTPQPPERIPLTDFRRQVPVP